MKHEQRQIYYDYDLHIEVYNLQGIVQKFPNHFHEYYVIGCIEGGKRHLWCKDKEYDIVPGDLILFNPKEVHCCGPLNNESLDYRAINISIDSMRRITKGLFGKEWLPQFKNTVIQNSSATKLLQEAYKVILNNEEVFRKEETVYFLLETIIKENKEIEEVSNVKQNDQITYLCDYMNTNYSEVISLDHLLSMVPFGKSYLLRSFTKEIGVSPYRYLQSIRINKAKQLLEQGLSILDIIGLIGFSDQSHFTKYFKDFIGVTPKQYQDIFSNEGGK